MSATTINYRGLSGVRTTINVDTTNDLDTIIGVAIADEGLNANYYVDFFLLRDNTILQSTSGGSTYADLGLLTTDDLVAVLDDDPATFDKETRQIRKLEIATIKRAADSRPSTYDINLLPNPYDGDGNAVDDGDPGPLNAGRPWT